MENTRQKTHLDGIRLKPRFTVKSDVKKEVIIRRFKDKFAHGNTDFIGKVVDQHIIIDVLKNDSHFWSPQLQLEVEQDERNTSIIKGLFGPKPQVWTLFMFVHFGVALAFMVFLVLAYTRWNLKQDYTFALGMTIAMPIFWILLYVLGQWGKKKGYDQMLEMDNFLSSILDK